MKIELRSRKHKSGNTTLYLEFYEKGGKRQYESLNLYLNSRKDRQRPQGKRGHSEKGIED